MHSKPCCSFNICCCCLHSKSEQNVIGRANTELGQTITKQPVLTISGTFKTFEEQYLYEHNRFRALHGCPGLKLNRNLSAYATEWAETLANRNMFLEYRCEGKFGENLFVAREYSVDAQMVVKSWYDEIWLYDFSKPYNVHHGVEHFTQVIWRQTKEMGVGIRTRDGNTWIVVNYEPKGNIIGQFDINVPRKLK